MAAALESVAEYLPGASWQRCVVHFYRNVFGHVPATKVREVSHMLKAIHAQESQDTAERKANAIIADLRAGKMSKAADIIERTVQETLTYYAFPDIHWQKIRTHSLAKVGAKAMLAAVNGAEVFSKPGNRLGHSSLAGQV